MQHASRADLRPTHHAVREGAASRIERAIAAIRVVYVGSAADLERVEAHEAAGRGGCGGGRWIAPLPTAPRPEP